MDENTKDYIIKELTKANDVLIEKIKELELEKAEKETIYYPSGSLWTLSVGNLEKAVEHLRAKTGLSNE